MKSLSGKKKTRFDFLDPNRFENLGLEQAEPYLGSPGSDNSVLIFDSDGSRRFEVPPVFLPGNEIQAQQTNVDADIYHVFVDAIGTNSQFLADTGVRYNPGRDTMYIDQDLVVGQDITANNVTVTGEVTSTSDARVKENLWAVDPGLALHDILALTGYLYNRTDLEGNPQQYGLIAQEVQKLYPQMVRGDSEGKLSLSYQQLIPILIQAIKELEQRVTNAEQHLRG